MTVDRSRVLMERAERVLPGGVSSPVRARRTGGAPALVMADGDGAFVVDADGNRYLDFVLGYGPHILGHAPPAVVAAVVRQARRGNALGATHELEIELAERIVDAVPSVEMVRFVNSGTEATMSAIRLARAATGRDRIVKCAGGYHGHADALLTGGGSGVATLGIPGSPGVPAAAVAHTIVIPFNDGPAAVELFDRIGNSVAALIVEPVAGNMGCVPPRAGYLETLREVTARSGVVLIFDEVMTGFRVAYGGAQSLYGVAPDLTCLGKVIGGGFPVGAYGGGRPIMSRMAPTGPVYQAGTLSGNPVAMAAGCVVLDELRSGKVYDRLEALGQRFAFGLRSVSEELSVPCAVNRVGSMITPFLGVDAVDSFDGARAADRERFGRLHTTWLESAVNWPPSQFETGFLSTAHSPEDIDRAVAGFRRALAGPWDRSGDRSNRVAFS